MDSGQHAETRNATQCQCSVRMSVATFSNPISTTNPSSINMRPGMTSMLNIAPKKVNVKISPLKKLNSGLIAAARTSTAIIDKRLAPTAHAANSREAPTSDFFLCHDTYCRTKKHPSSALFVSSGVARSFDIRCINFLKCNPITLWVRGAVRSNLLNPMVSRSLGFNA